MLVSLNRWFSQHLQTAETAAAHNVELATAVLLYEIMRADNKFEPQEQAVYLQQLEEHFTLTAEELAELCELTSKQAEEAVDFQQFTSVINDSCDINQKRLILDSLWLIAFSDHDLSGEEEYTIRKIADLLYLPHSQFIKSKLAVLSSIKK
ncbi:MAG: putative tellurite resistance protein B-like protein [Paraglaciecola sp.]|jgi:uncharacterized tellurite resistance protein B-like protein